MKTQHIAMITVLLTSVFTSLSAQDNPVPTREVPDARDYEDLLPGGNKPGKAKGETRGLPAESKAERPRAFFRMRLPRQLPSPQNKSRPKAETSMSSDAIEGILIEAQVRLEAIAGKLPEYEKSSQGGFDEALGIIDRALKEIRAGKKSEEARKKATVAKVVEDPAGETAGAAQPVLAKDKPAPSPLKVKEAGEKVIEDSNASIPPGPKVDSEDTGGELRLFKAGRLRRWAAQLRTLADQMVKEADEVGSKSN